MYPLACLRNHTAYETVLIHRERVSERFRPVFVSLNALCDRKRNLVTNVVLSRDIRFQWLRSLVHSCRVCSSSLVSLTCLSHTHVRVLNKYKHVCTVDEKENTFPSTRHGCATEILLGGVRLLADRRPLRAASVLSASRSPGVHICDDIR